MESGNANLCVFLTAVAVSRWTTMSQLKHQNQAFSSQVVALLQENYFGRGK